MNKLKFVATLIIVSVCLGSTLPAQERSFDCSDKSIFNAKRADQILSKVQERYRGITNFAAEFLQSSYLSALEVSEASSGSLIFSKPGKMRWEYRTPDKQLFITDGDSLWLYQEEDNQVLIDKFSKAFVSDLPVSFLVGLGDLKKDFESAKICENPDGYVLELTPKGKGDTKEEGLERLKLLASTTNYLIKGASVIDLSGNVTSFLFRAIDTEKKLKGEEFALAFPKGVDVIDRR